MQDDNMNHRFADDLQQDLAHGRVVEWAEMYALDAVSEEERRSIEEYISGAGPDMRSEFDARVRAARETITRAYAQDEAEPPAKLLERIIAGLPEHSAAAGEATVAGEAADDSVSSVHSESTDKPESGDGSHSTDDLARRRTARQRRGSPVTRWLVAAAAAVVITVGGVSIAQNLQTTSLEQEVLQAEDVRRGEVEIEAGGTAELAFSRAENAAVVTLSGIPAPPEGMVYQMWRLPADGSMPLSVGTMTGEEVAGENVTTVEDIESYSGVAITVEPEGGSEEPTLPIMASIPFDV